MAGLEGSRDLQDKLIALQNGTASRAVLMMLGQEVVSLAKKKVPRKTGNLDRTIRVDEVSADDQSLRVVAGSTNGRVGYAQYVEFGTGIYGPKRRPIVPVRAKALRFPAIGAQTRLSGNLTSAQQRAGGGFQFRKSVRGRRATPFLYPAASEAARNVGLAPAVVKVWNDAS